MSTTLDKIKELARKATYQETAEGRTVALTPTNIEGMSALYKLLPELIAELEAKDRCIDFFRKWHKDDVNPMFPERAALDTLDKELSQLE